MVTEQTPLVSIVVGFLNEEVFLSEAVESILKQEYTNWELLLVDDGSRDDSVIQAREFARQYPSRIRYLYHEGHVNKGLSASRNLGITKSNGELIAFLDADDVWLPNKLTQQVAIMQQYSDVTLLCEASEYWFSWEDSSKSDVVQPVGTLPGRSYAPPHLMIDLYPLGQGAAPCPSGLMIRRSLAHNRWFEESFNGIYAMYEDQAFLSKMYLHENVYISSACTNRYRQRNGSIVQAVHESGKYHQVRKFYLDWLENYMNVNNITDGRVRRRLWKAQLAYRFPLLHRIIAKLAYC